MKLMVNATPGNMPLLELTKALGLHQGNKMFSLVGIIIKLEFIENYSSEERVSRRN